MRCLKLTPAILACALVLSCSRDPRAIAARHIASGDEYVEKRQFSAAIIEYRSALQADARFMPAQVKLARAYAATNDHKNAYVEYRRASDLMPDDIQVQLEFGNIQLLGGDFDDARERADTILRKDPSNLGGLILLGNALAGLRDFEHATSVTERAIRVAPELEGGSANPGALPLARRNRAEAEQAFQKAITLNPKSISGYLSLASFYRAVDELPLAEAALKRALELDSTNFRASVALADNLASQRRTAEALNVLEKLSADLLGRHPNDARALTLEARLLLAERRVHDALVKARAAIQADPKSADGHFVLGRIHVVRNELEAARREFTEARNLSPGRLDALIELSRLHRSRKETDIAIQIATEAVRTHQKSVEARIALVQSLLVRPEDHPKAYEHVQNLVRDFPSSPTATAALGRFYLTVKDTAAARREFERALDMDAGYQEALAQLVAIDMSTGRLSEAHQRLRERLQKQPDDPVLLLMSAKVALAEGRLPDAERILRHLLTVDGANLEGYTLLGQLYIASKRLPAATREFAAIVERDPNSSTAHTMLGLLYHAQQRLPQAIAHYDKALQSDPQAATAANNLAWILAETDQDLDRALQLAQAAKARFPNDATIIDTLGWVYLKRDMVPVATTTLEEAVRLDPNNALYSYHLGVTYAKAGEEAKAQEALERVLKLEPVSARAEEAKRILARLVH